METGAEHQALVDDGRRSAEQPGATMPETPATPSFRWPGYLAHQTIGEENHINHLPSQEFELEAENTEQSSDDPRLLWPPKYLRRSVIATFILIFAFLIVAIEALVIVSARNDGIATSRSELHYLWTYGPTAFLTLVAAFWSRVEYQSKLVAPWRNLMQQHSVDSEHTLLLDYISGLQPLIIVKAFRNRDWMVLITCTVSILIKILIVISTGLVTLSWIKVHLNAQPIVLKDTFFNNDSRRLSETKLTSYYIMQGLISQNLSYPDGMSKDYAFQSTMTTLPDSAETRVTVDGLKNGLDCVPVDFGIPRGDFQVTFLAGGGTTYKGNVNVSIASSGCNITNQPLAIPDWFNVYGASAGFIARFTETKCDGTEGDQGRRVLVMFGNMTLHVDYSRNLTMDPHDAARYDTRHPFIARLNRSTQMLCSPTYIIRRVEVVRNGTRPVRVIPVVGSLERTLSYVHPWTIMDAQLKSVSNFRLIIITFNQH